MSKSYSLSLPAAILVSINIMFGTGTFINTVIVAKHTGGLGGGLYLLAGVLMLPLILCIARLSSMHSQGNFYNFGAMISPFWGFISTWIYFIAKLASASLSIHVFVTFLRSIVPLLQTVPHLLLDYLIVMFFVLLNLLNTKTGTRIQAFFVTAKATPLLFAVGAGLYYANIINLAPPHLIWQGIPVALPLVLFCCLGFEASCSLSRVIENSKVNAPRAIVISFTIVVLLAALYQFLFYASLGTLLTEQTNYVGAFPALLGKITPSLKDSLTPLFSLAIASSALGGAYGIMYSNSWNLFSLAEQPHLPALHFLKTFNRHQIPYLCVLAEGLVCLLFLTLTQGQQIPLQYTATLGSILAYTISIMALYRSTGSALSIFGFTTCITLLLSTINAFLSTSVTPLIIFASIVLTGIVFFVTTHTLNEKTKQSQ